jgi:hypothetical protein
MADVKKGGVNQGDLVQVLYDLQTQFNTLRAEYDVLVAKLNADAGVTDANYAATASAAVTGVVV